MTVYCELQLVKVNKKTGFQTKSQTSSGLPIIIPGHFVYSKDSDLSIIDNHVFSWQ